MAATVIPITQTASFTSVDDSRHGTLSTTPEAYLSARQTPAHLLHSTSGVPSEPIHPLHALALVSTQELHIVKLTTDSLSVGPGPSPEVLHKVGSAHHAHHATDSTDSTVGPPPPSPPSSTEDDPDFCLPVATSSRPEPPQSSRPVTFENGVHEPRSSLGLHGIPGRSSTDTRSSISQPPRITRKLNLSDASSMQPTPFPESPPSPTYPHTSADGYLQAPAMTPHGPHKRRNTTGSSIVSSIPSVSTTGPTRMKTIHSPNHAHGMDGDEAVGEGLESEMEQQAAQIRRERQSKRQAEKAKVQAESALTRTISLVRGTSLRGDEGPLVGNLIGEDHVNYVMMYNMLTGIRIAVSRCQAKIRRPLTDEDYTAANKYSFDIVGNELTPSAKYDFKFKDYAPWVFRELREDYFHLDPADYLLSLTAKYILSELGSPGKSGSFFYFSRDYRFIIKTIHHNEHKFLRRILKQYYEHVKDNPHTLLSRFYGLHRVKLPRGRKIHFVIMNNLFPPHRDIHETYDLKGSTVGREYPEEKAEKNPRATLKDLNWINRGKTLELGPEKRALLTEQLRRDSELLKRLQVMDYSLLVGIHNMQRGNRDNVRSNTLKVFSPNMPLIKRKPTQVKGPSSPDAIALRRIMRESDPKRLGSGTISLPDEDTAEERQHFLFYQDEGGLRATDELNENMDPIYYLGIIDILTPYNSLKKLEHFWKGLSADRHKISPVPPEEYGDRFFAFMKAIMRGGEGGGRFKAE